MIWLLAPLLTAAAFLAAAAESPGLRLDSRLTWTGPDPEFGEFSGLALFDDGSRLLTVSDRGMWATAELERTDGSITGIRPTGFGPLHAISGRPLGQSDVDAEGLAIDAQGRAYVSFEAFHRVRRYDDIDGPATDLPEHAHFRRLQHNSGLEALAIDAGGVLYAIPERSGAWERPYPVFRFDGETWDRDLSVRRDGRFLPVGADFGPDGKLYLLEREFRWLGGFATRIRRFELGPDGFDAGATLYQSGFGTLDNMEGISVWRDGGGNIRVTLISDDNQFPLQKTELVEFVLTEP